LILTEELSTDNSIQSKGISPTPNGMRRGIWH